MLLVGIDLVDVKEVDAALTAFGERYRRRVLSEAESHAWPGATLSSTALAERVAAKEAATKVLRPEEDWLDWRDIALHSTSSGTWQIALHGRAYQLATEAGITSIDVSFARGGQQVLAVAVGHLAGAASPAPADSRQPAPMPGLTSPTPSQVAAAKTNGAS
ncbi:MAG: holo-ACP synthase [Acidimicrobiales bacterium]